MVYKNASELNLNSFLSMKMIRIGYIKLNMNGIDKIKPKIK